MDKYFIALSQIRSFRRRQIALYFLTMTGIIILLTGIFVMYYLLRDNEFFSFIYLGFIKVDGTFITLYILFSLAVTIISGILIYILYDMAYREYYENIIFNEAKLDDIFLMEHKIHNDKKLAKNLNKMFAMVNERIVQSYSDASSRHIMNMSRIAYVRDHYNHIGTLFSVRFEQERGLFFRLGKDNFRPAETYNNRELVTYGFSSRSLLKDYVMLSTVDFNNRELEKNDNAACIIRMERFLKEDIEIIFDNDTLYIFIDDFKIFLSNHMFVKVSNETIEDKLDAIKELHEVWSELVSMFERVFNSSFND